VLIVVSISVYGFYSFRVIDRSRITVTTYTATTTPSSATAINTISTVSTYTTTSIYMIATTSIATTTPPTATTTSMSTVSVVADSDSDGIPDYLEEQYGLDPSKPNPSAAYLLKHGLTDYLHIVKPLDNDGIMQENEKNFIDTLLKNQDLLKVKTFENYLSNISKDGKIDESELNKLKIINEKTNLLKFFLTK